MSKHAYLIISHCNWNQLHFLTEILNDDRNDFYLMIDSKSTDFNRELFIKSSSCKHLFFVDSVDIRWGDYSLFEATLKLLKASTSKDIYSYYHLISGVDMPLKNQYAIHKFFDEHQGIEFVDYDNFYDTSLAHNRIRYHYYFQRQVGRKRFCFIKLLRDFWVKTEQILGIDRCKEIKNYLGKGSNWFSITDDFARFIIDNEPFIIKYFSNTYICDEIIVQTLLKMSPYINNWYGFNDTSIQYQNLRYMDWDRGAPYSFEKDDYFSLIKGNYLFARKFKNDIISDEIKEYVS